MAELVAKNATAIAVDENLTTLIDWTNIESLSGFTIMIENAGGGSGNDITDVQIDTSDDGGTTSELDQHADTPAVPIASGAIAKETFAETAKFVRVRALCTEGEDTTANAWLIADSSSGRICMLADIKDRLGIANTENDSLINRIILGIEQIFNQYTDRQLLQPATDITEYYTGCSPYLQLYRYPVISITSIKESSLYDFDNTDALTADTDYRLVNVGKKGIIYRIFSKWLEIQDAIQVVYRGGFCPAGQTLVEGETTLPADLREAAIEQVSFIFKRRHDIGLSSEGFMGGSISKFSSIDLLPLVKAVLDNYKRRSPLC